MERTYVDACLKDGLTVRWPDSAMPIRVYVAPFRWYEKTKQMESSTYNQMVWEAFQRWTDISKGLIRFQQVPTVNDSQIDIKWRRVDLKSLGHCEYLVNKQSLLYSAEIQIGISDGILYAQYDDMDEVRHTILHEVGHALGLVGHSDDANDIMYVPHQYGVVDLSERDIKTLRTLYKLPTAFDYLALGRKHNLPEPFTFHDVLDCIEGVVKAKKQKTIDFVPPPPPEKPEVLLEQHQILSQMGKFHLATQNINIDPALKKLYRDQKLKPPGSPDSK